ncbi:hypothetical protein HII36_46485 [Nonomuraea sp. NN258]|uniref:hypothetical protein n=1 Tax=Nonomuraea antri TaxID=2730852 RepID=UPI00156A16D4|nr:hypothetical protein [Nonomuraea antri]NRQ39222.1 hypothetical protein [Nonomuraea antri]
MAEIPYDRQEQLAQIQSGLMPGEQIIAVYDAIGAGTGFLGLTDRRVIVQDKSFAGNFFSSGSIAVHVGTHTYEVEFRGDNKAHHVHNVILHFIARN